MKAKNLKAYQSPRHHFPGKKARRISFIPFLLLLCMLTTLAGCQSKRPFAVSAEKGIVSSLSRTIYMTDGTTREMAENVITEPTGTGDPIPVWDAFFNMYHGDTIVLFEVIGFVAMGVQPKSFTSLLKVKIVHTLTGNIWRESSPYIIISYDKMVEFYDDLVIPTYNEMKEKSRE